MKGLLADKENISRMVVSQLRFIPSVVEVFSEVSVDKNVSN